MELETAEAWDFVYRAGQRYPQLLRAALTTFANARHSNWGKHLPDQDLPHLYRLKRSVPALREESETFDWPAEVRQNLLSHLAARGTLASVDGLASLKVAFPTDAAVQCADAEGRQRYRERSWRPVEPEWVFELRQSTSRRVVQSREHLLEIVLEVIDGYEQSLQAKAPGVVDLWNWTQARRLQDMEYTPKDEQALSDHLKRHLSSALPGVLVNREVEIAPTVVERRSGENADLLVQALGETSSVGSMSSAGMPAPGGPPAIGGAPQLDALIAFKWKSTYSNVHPRVPSEDVPSDCACSTCLLGKNRSPASNSSACPCRHPTQRACSTLFDDTGR